MGFFLCKGLASVGRNKNGEIIIPEAGRGFSHCRTQLRSRHDGHQKPTLWLLGGDYRELFCSSRILRAGIYHISPFTCPVS